jgi:hypothetical protein
MGNIEKAKPFIGAYLRKGETFEVKSQEGIELNGQEVYLAEWFIKGRTFSIQDFFHDGTDPCFIVGCCQGPRFQFKEEDFKNFIEGGAFRSLDLQNDLDNDSKHQAMI